MITVTIENENISFNGMNLKKLLSEVYAQGRIDGVNDLSLEKVTFIALSSELQAQGRTISVRTLIYRAKEANVKTYRYDGNRKAILRKDISKFIDKSIANPDRINNNEH